MPGLNLVGTPSSQDYNLGRGAVFLADLDAVTRIPLVFRHLGNCPEFTVTAEVETLEHQSSREGLKVTDLEVTISQKLSVGVTLDELNFQNVALFFSGEAEKGITNLPSDVSTVILEPQVTGGTGLPDGFGVWVDMYDDNGARIYDLDERAGPVGPTIIVSALNPSSGASTALVLWDPSTGVGDYELDYIMGRVFIRADADTVDANFVVNSGISLSYTAGTGGGVEDPNDLDEVRALTTTSVTKALKFIAINPAAANHQTEYQFHQTKLKAEGDLSLIGDEVTTMQLNGVAEKNELADLNSPTLTIRTFAGAKVA